MLVKTKAYPKGITFNHYGKKIGTADVYVTLDVAGAEHLRSWIEECAAENRDFDVYIEVPAPDGGWKARALYAEEKLEELKKAMRTLVSAGGK